MFTWYVIYFFNEIMQMISVLLHIHNMFIYVCVYVYTYITVYTIFVHICTGSVCVPLSARGSLDWWLTPTIPLSTADELRDGLRPR